MTLALTGMNVYIYYCWGWMTSKQAKKNFVFSETNFYNMGNYQCLFLSPLSFENNFFFWLNLPGLIYSGLLIESFAGSGVLLGAYLLNCRVSAATTPMVHRQLGYHKV